MLSCCQAFSFVRICYLARHEERRDACRGLRDVDAGRRAAVCQNKHSGCAVAVLQGTPALSYCVGTTTTTAAAAAAAPAAAAAAITTTTTTTMGQR